MDFINDQPGPTLGQSLGSMFNRGINQGMQALAQHKLQEIAQGKLQNALSGLGIQNPEQVSQMPLEALKPLIEARSKNLYPQGSDEDRELARQRHDLNERRLNLLEETEKERLAQGNRSQDLRERGLDIAQDKPAQLAQQKLKNDWDKKIEVLTEKNQGNQEFEAATRLQADLKHNEPMTTPTMVKLLRKVGLDKVGGWTNPANEEARALTLPFMKSFRSILGGQFAAAEAENVLAALASEMNSPGGIDRVADLMTMMANTSQGILNAAEKIPSKEGLIPKNWQFKLDKATNEVRLEQTLRHLASKVKKRAAASRPKGLPEGIIGPRMDVLPPAADSKGKRVWDNGTVKVSDGNEWKAVGA